MPAPIRSIRDLATAVRGRRLDLGLSQSALAERAHVSRQWIVELEAGKSTAEIGLVLRLLDALGFSLSLDEPGEAGKPAVDLDALLDDHRAR